MDLAYLGGFFDGEGCVGIYGSQDGRKASLVVQITQNDGSAERRLMEELRAMFGGRLSDTGPPDRIKMAYALNGDAAAAFLAVLLPHLRLKREQAELGLAWHRQRRPPGRDGRGRLVAKGEAQRLADLEAMTLIRSMKRRAK